MERTFARSPATDSAMERIWVVVATTLILPLLCTLPVVADGVPFGGCEPLSQAATSITEVSSIARRHALALFSILSTCYAPPGCSLMRAGMILGINYAQNKRC